MLADLRFHHLTAGLPIAISGAVSEIAAVFHESGLRGGGRMPLPCVRAEDVIYLLECEIAFLDPIVEMRRKSHAGFRPEVREDFTSQEFAADFVGMGTLDRNGACPFRWIFRCIDAPTA